MAKLEPIFCFEPREAEAEEGGGVQGVTNGCWHQLIWQEIELATAWHVLPEKEKLISRCSTKMYKVQRCTYKGGHLLDSHSRFGCGLRPPQTTGTLARYSSPARYPRCGSKQFGQIAGPLQMWDDATLEYPGCVRQ